MEYISKNINYLVSQSGLSKDAYGAKLGLGRNIVGQYIADKYKPKLEVLQAISKMHGISLDDLVNNDLSIEEKTLHMEDKVRHENTEGETLPDQNAPTKGKNQNTQNNYMQKRKDFFEEERNKQQESTEMLKRTIQGLLETNRELVEVHREQTATISQLTKTITQLTAQINTSSLSPNLQDEWLDKLNERLSAMDEKFDQVQADILEIKKKDEDNSL